MAPTMLSVAERIDWLRLIRTEYVGPIVFHQLIARYGSAGAALADLPRLARRGGGARVPRICSAADAQREIERLERLGGRLVARAEPAYPLSLAAIEDAPPIVAVLGNIAALSRPTVAVVGARNASANGRRLSHLFAEGLSKAGYLVGSGLARGIDTAAHVGALQAAGPDAGSTVAVVAGGVDIAYPPENAALMARIATHGTVIAECPLGTVPHARHFPRRNRIISGLSLAVVVIEAAAKSGSLITARMALDQGRDVFAVPGSPLDPRSRGGNGLIRQGAALVEGPEDVLALLGPRAGRHQPTAGSPSPTMSEPDPKDVETAQLRVLELLGPDPVEVDELIRQCQLSAPAVLAVLLDLELAGRLERLAVNRVARLS